MNNLMLLTDDQLNKAVADMNKRAAALDTPRGQEIAAGRMLEILHLIDAAGYEAKTDIANMAMSWVMLLRDQIEAYGFDTIRKAVCDFIRNDTREYKQFPSVGQIREQCSAIGANPKAELSRRREEELVRRMRAERQAELAALSTEYKAACVAKYKPMLTALYGCRE